LPFEDLKEFRSQFEATQEEVRLQPPPAGESRDAGFDGAVGGSGDTVTVAGQSRHVIGYMKDFLFRPEQARTPVGVLSGGERARLTLARAFARPSNLLVLDERSRSGDARPVAGAVGRVSRYGAAGQP
jgi:ABC-type molybdenum transport system ATPase subunit/photorepair protein PhrA